MGKSPYELAGGTESTFSIPEAILDAQEPPETRLENLTEVKAATNMYPRRYARKHASALQMSDRSVLEFYKSRLTSISIDNCCNTGVKRERY
ncbi:hypothetical protein NPIL_576761 [Nephila pilipes]|uniref:Uncharacterized protein n=1 Tax=Nephila pilipes TaxID=299642 RepID=A0A8X6MX05_NEPPI|nr:hypothetical protein NPIL_576761 [Nephila pilipes]